MNINHADEILFEFVLSYLNRNKKLTAEQWLTKKLSESLPDVSPNVISKLHDDILQSLEQFNDFVEDAKNAAEKSYNAETWFYKKLIESSSDKNFRDLIFLGDDILRETNRDIFDVSRNFEDLEDNDDKIILKNNFGSANRENIHFENQLKKFSNNNSFVTKEDFQNGLFKSVMSQYQKTLRTDLGNMAVRNLDLNETAYSLSKNAALNGVGGLVFSVGLSMILKNNFRAMEQREIVKLLATSGATTGLRSAVAGALKVGAERGFFPMISRATPELALVAVANLGIENSKIIYKLSQGEINAWQAIDQAGRVSTSSIYALGFGVKGATIGAASFSIIPVAGSLVGGLLGGIVGNMVGNKVGNFSYERVKNFVLFAKDFVTLENNMLEIASHEIYSPLKRKVRAVRKNLLSEKIF